MDRQVLYPVVIWIGMAIVAVINGIVRELFIIDRFGDRLGHIFSTIFLTGVILWITYLFFSRSEIPYSRKQLLGIGVGWSALTIGFEFVVGYIEGSPPSAILAQYNVLSGSIWVVVPITLLLAPLVLGSLTR